MNKENLHNEMKANKAWDKLYARLYSENLIPQEEHSKGAKHWLSPVLLLGAAAIIIFAGIAILHLRDADNHGGEILVSQINNEKASLVKVLEDGSTVYIAQKTALKYPMRFTVEERVVSLKGEAFFDISKNPDRPFIIETELVKVEVLGTSFNIKSAFSNQFELSVREGRVKVTLKKSGEERILYKNETAILSDTGFNVKHENCDSLLGRYTVNFKFKDETLKNIVGVINKLHPEFFIEISPEVESRKLTVAFANDRPETMITLICQALGLNSLRSGNKFSIK
jgi:ferric-dicitrate binding protein FerR (iron transport regulator)